MAGGLRFKLDPEAIEEIKEMIALEVDRRAPEWKPKRDELVSLREACRLIGVHKSAMYNMVNRGEVRHVKTPTGRIRIYADSLLKPGNVEPRD